MRACAAGPSGNRLEEKLRVMLIDARQARSDELTSGLEEAGCLVVHRSTPSSDLERAVAECAPEVIIIDLDSPDRDTLEGMCRLGGEQPRPIVMFMDETDRESIRSAVHAGVAAYVVKGSSPERVRPVLDVAIERFRRHEALEAELREMRSTLDQRKLVERAKGILMEKRGVSENDAYKTLRSMAMSRSVKIHEVASRVIDMEDLL